MPLYLSATWTSARFKGSTPLLAGGGDNVYAGARDGNDIPYVPGLETRRRHRFRSGEKWGVNLDASLRFQHCGAPVTTTTSVLARQPPATAGSIRCCSSISPAYYQVNGHLKLLAGIQQPLRRAGNRQPRSAEGRAPTRRGWFMPVSKPHSEPPFPICGLHSRNIRCFIPSRTRHAVPHPLLQHRHARHLAECRRFRHCGGGGSGSGSRFRPHPWRRKPSCLTRNSPSASPVRPRAAGKPRTRLRRNSPKVRLRPCRNRPSWHRWRNSHLCRKFPTCRPPPPNLRRPRRSPKPTPRHAAVAAAPNPAHPDRPTVSKPVAAGSGGGLSEAARLAAGRMPAPSYPAECRPQGTDRHGARRVHGGFQRPCHFRLCEIRVAMALAQPRGGAHGAPLEIPARRHHETPAPHRLPTPLEIRARKHRCRNLHRGRLGHVAHPRNLLPRPLRDSRPRRLVAAPQSTLRAGQTGTGPQRHRHR